jgi:hypothetical protein
MNNLIAPNHASACARDYEERLDYAEQKQARIETAAKAMMNDDRAEILMETRYTQADQWLRIDRMFDQACKGNPIARDAVLTAVNNMLQEQRAYAETYVKGRE